VCAPCECPPSTRPGHHSSSSSSAPAMMRAIGGCKEHVSANNTSRQGSPTPPVRAKKELPCHAVDELADRRPASRLCGNTQCRQLPRLIMGLSSLLYDAMSSELALFIPATYCRLMLGDERLSLRLSLAAAFGLLVLWLFSWRAGHGDWAAFSVVMVSLGASLLRPQHASAVAQLFARPTRFLLVGAAVGVIAAVGKPLAYHLFPISELALAYSTAELFAGAALEPAAARLALISITSQLPLGVVTTNNLRAAQQRKSALLTVGTEGGTTATKFTRLVAGASEWPEPKREAARAERALPSAQVS
jgi:hypothetical protein